MSHEAKYASCILKGEERSEEGLNSCLRERVGRERVGERKEEKEGEKLREKEKREQKEREKKYGIKERKIDK